MPKKYIRAEDGAVRGCDLPGDGVEWRRNNGDPVGGLFMKDYTTPILASSYFVPDLAYRALGFLSGEAIDGNVCSAADDTNIDDGIGITGCRDT